MGTPPPIVTAPRLQPGVGRGWTNLAGTVAAQLPVGSIQRIWVFPPLRHEEREWGTAVLALLTEGERWAVHTARYLTITRGRKKGQGRVELEFVGESPPEVIDDVLRGVQDRTGDPDPPVEIASGLWFSEEDDQSPTQG